MRLGLLAATGLGLLPAALLFAFAPAYLGRSGEIAAGDLRFGLVAEYSSVFGNLKVVELEDRQAPGRSQMLFLTDGLVQTRLSPDGVSLSEYTYVLEALASAYVPEARTALVLGLGAGVVPRELASRGVAVDAVEINPDMAAAARAYVTPDPAWSTHIADARTFVRNCSRPYDLVVIDLFHGDGTPDYLLSADFFASLRRCLGPDGAAIMNAFASDRASAGYRHLLATVQSVFPAVVDFHRPAGEGELNFNAYVVALTAPRAPGPVLLSEVPELLHRGLAATLDSASGDTAIGDAAPVTDAHNIFSILNLDDQLAYRRLVAPQLPPQMLVN